MQTHQVTNAAVRRVRRRHRLCHRRRTTAGSRRLSRAPRRRTCSPARWCSAAPPGPSTCATSTSGGPGHRAPAGITRAARGRRPRNRERPSRRARRVRRRCGVRGVGRPRAAHRGRVGGRRPRRPRRRRLHLGRRARTARPAAGQLLARRVPVSARHRLRTDDARSAASRPTVRAVRHGRQRVGVDHRLVRR